VCSPPVLSREAERGKCTVSFCRAVVGNGEVYCSFLVGVFPQIEK
jgi:hypothetical protein